MKKRVSGKIPFLFLIFISQANATMTVENMDQGEIDSFDQDIVWVKIKDGTILKMYKNAIVSSYPEMKIGIKVNFATDDAPISARKSK